MHQEAPTTDSTVNFMNYLEWHLSAGTYILCIPFFVVIYYILMKLAIRSPGAAQWGSNSFCLPFTFSVHIISNSVSTPRIVALEPSGGSNLDPNGIYICKVFTLLKMCFTEPLLLSLVFSVPATVNLPAGSSLVTYPQYNS